jgi:Ni/Fe-hydrogenase subunit HybB-like protein
MHRVRRLKLALWFVAGLAAAVAAARYVFGLGATTNLSDATPWGLWIGFDVLSGVALAAGGFILTATVYIFKLEKFHPIVRPAVLTAFLGYIAVVVGLLVDVGLPWNIWHMIIYWNLHSPLLEVGWCVMLYLTVLALEFFPVPAEEFSALAKIRGFLIRMRLPLVIAGIGLSTLHQSSLGSLFLLTPYHLHPLWYSPLLPVHFFVSAVGLGLMMVVFESHSTAYLYGRKPETALLERLGAAAQWVLAGYLALRFGDLAVRGQLGHLTGTEWQVRMFWLEMAVSAVVPIVLLFIPVVRRARGGQWGAATLVVFGMVLNRVNAGGLAQLGRGDSLYLPAWTEITVSAGVVSAVVLAFLYVVERFNVWEERPADPDADPSKLPEFDKVGATWLGVPVVAGRTLYSLAFIVAAAAGFGLLRPQLASSRGVEPAPVRQARGGDTLWIDGNLDGYGASFDHQMHQLLHGEKASCALCHHMSLPRDAGTGCHHCHSDMYQATDAFLHDWHASPKGGNLACMECHPQGETRVGDTAKGCEQCHSDLVPSGAAIAVEQYRAPGYAHAMHRLCIGCHVDLAGQGGVSELTQCATCHYEIRDFVDAEELKPRGRRLGGKGVVLPPY